MIVEINHNAKIAVAAFSGTSKVQRECFQAPALQLQESTDKHKKFVSIVVAELTL